MHLDPIIPALCALLAVVLALGIALRRLRQPHVVAYIVAGVLLGPSAIGIVQDADIKPGLGSIGVVLKLLQEVSEADTHVGRCVTDILLAQVGELSFVLAAVGYQAQMIGEYAY